MDYKFCDFTNDEENGILDVFKISFEYDTMGRDRLIEIYKIFVTNFNSKNPPDKIETIKRNHLAPLTTDNVSLERFMDTDFQIGIDLPVLLRPKEDSNKTVFIVAQDPLRTFKNPQEGVIFSTPFGVHDIRCINDKKLMVNWKVTEWLLKEGYRVYITDVLKLWMKKEKERKERITRDLFENFQRSLLKEIEVFRPELILTYGTQASLLVQQAIQNSRIKNIAFIHPAGTANGKWIKILANCTAENKINYIINKIQNTIKQQPTTSS